MRAEPRATVPALLIALLIALAGCASSSPAPIVDKAPGTGGMPPPITKQSAPRPAGGGSVYRVRPGDTLYSIAFRFGVDHREIAQWNRLTDPDRIIVGQELRLKAPATAAVGTPGRTPVAGTPRLAAPPATAVATPLPAPAAVPAVPAPLAATTAGAAASRTAAGLQWRWPATGTATRAVAATGSIGLEIRGSRGQPVYAAAPGQVVYSGNGLRGYGQLIIIKHNDTFLSAYAHNDKLLIDEGTRVDGGQQIAAMGDSEAAEVMLHFEIRKGGKAVEPLQYLPQR